MYETITENFGLLRSFAVLGFAFGMLYEFFRVFRRFIPHNHLAVAIEDFVYLSFGGLFTFAYSMEYGTGQFRIFFFLAEVLGGTVYFLTLGALISFLTKKFADGLRRLIRHIIDSLIIPTATKIVKSIKKLCRKLVIIYNNLLIRPKNALNDLKSRAMLMYNKSKPVKNKTEGKRDVIKARVTKKA